ncbi:MAG: MarR family transcriptional regulator [Chloroflexota bacterium]
MSTVLHRRLLLDLARLVDLGHRARQLLTDCTKRYAALTPEQVIVLVTLDDAKRRLTISELSDVRSRANHTTTSVVARLHREGLVRRSREGNHDRRVVWVSITDEGRQRLKQCEQGFSALWGHHPQSEYANRMDSLRRALEAVEELLPS